jgi:PAS domain S-box-containing protein
MEPAVKVLLIEDSPVDSRLLQLLLSESTTSHFELTHVERLSEGLKRLSEERFDVALSDLTLPDSHGFETFQALHARAPDMPIIVLSGVDDETLAVKAVREGAQDYLVKGRVDGHVLSRAIFYAIERHRTEQALQESENHYKYLLESITDYSYTVRLENGRPIKTIHGPGCISVTGYYPMDYEATPDLWYQMIHEADRAAVEEQARRALAGETPPPVEHRIIHKNGQVRWVRNTVVPSRDREGRLVAYDGLIADVTERKRAEEKLVTSEAFYHSLVENLPQNILRKDLKEQFTFANQRFCSMLGKPLEEIIGKTDFDFFPPGLAAKYQRDDRHVIRTGQTFETVEENVAPNGAKTYVNVIKTPIYDAKGKIIGIQGIFWDITERKRFEQQLQKANEELARSEADLRKSHEELKSAQLQLIQAEKMESIGTLAAGVAHEVKNPRAIMMMGFNYLTKKFPPGDENLGLVLKEMKEAIGRADSITRGLLDFSASRQLAIKSQDLNTLIEGTLQLVRHELAQKRIHLVKEWGERLPHVGVDKTQIQQVFVNIFLNAIHATPQEGTITVRTYVKQLTETSHSEGSRKAAAFWVGDTAVVAEVDDTGSGIPDEYLARIYDPFFTTKPTGMGTGLGLPVSKKIIELHGGSVDIRNRKTGGVRVTIMLKAQREQT